jgi:PTH1 family peptidyl-tRNA hydrolase
LQKRGIAVPLHRDVLRKTWNLCSVGTKQTAAEQMTRMRLIVGLGNPGIEYAWTPHNLGFLVVDKLAEEAGIRVTRPESKSLVGIGQIAGQDVVLAKPQTMMNLSGLAVGELVKRAGCEPSDVIVVCDDIALPWGMIRVRERGSAGGHNGLKSVIGALGSMEFPRVRLGVQPEGFRGDLKEYVLRQIRRDEEDMVAEEVEQGAEAVKVILGEGTQSAMNRLNHRVTPPDEDDLAKE